MPAYKQGPLPNPQDRQMSVLSLLIDIGLAVGVLVMLTAAYHFGRVVERFKKK